ncbi:hypothetical protein AVEN_80952-1 [Araneus ventricosus]|uniref:Uncharacterized protein n=1 Tax=Araneus ventricosus TaxID=182803 RepID=A0A4Y2TZW6_ARAVE|nr:hypothetical protein AVEN_80952-1 [Araneus ventricosus]
MVSIAKEFIRVERMRDWQAHLNCVKEIFPYFHASGPFPYAKSAHLYLQDMLQLENLIDPSVFGRSIQGFLTVRRSAKFSCRTSTEMIIEQSLMQSIKNTHNKSRFISMLSEKLKAADIFVKQTNNDADVLII